MATQSPFSWAEGLFGSLPTPTPPAWMVDETQRKCLLVLNHVLMQEPPAMARLQPHTGRVIHAQWRSLRFQLQITPAGLFDRAPNEAPADLSLSLTEESPIALAQQFLQGSKPALRIEGDVQLASDVNWLAENLRWDAEEDLARLLGDVPAHLLVEAVRNAAAALRSFLGQRSNNNNSSSNGVGQPSRHASTGKPA